MSQIRNPYLCLFIVALGNFLFSFNTAVISGVMLFVQRDFSLSTAYESMLASMILMGALMGVCLASHLANRFGRKRTLIQSTLLVILGTLLAALAGSPWQLIIGRLVQGLGSGLASVVVPMYLAEFAPPKNRGAFLVTGSLIGSLGILATFASNTLLAAEGHWRLMIGLALFPAAVQLAGLLYIPESPAWKGPSFSQKNNGWSVMWKPSFRKALSVGILVNMLQQLIGINAVLYFAPRIFQQVGEGTQLATEQGATLGTLGIGVIGFVVTLFTVGLVDRYGRRPLLLISLPGVMICLLSLALALWWNLSCLHMVALIALCAYNVFYSLGMVSIPALMTSEIYPVSIRGQAMSLAGITNWGANYLVVLTFLPLSQCLTLKGLFLLYALFALFGTWFVYFQVPETKGKSLDEIEKMEALYPKT